ncbi:MAG: immunoglobulin domain-containing protein [Opitutaceae bacterium]
MRVIGVLLGADRSTVPGSTMWRVFLLLLLGSLVQVTAPVADAQVVSGPIRLSSRDKLHIFTVGLPSSLKVTTDGSGAVTYQWIKDDVAIAGATNNQLNFPSPTLSDAGYYACVVTDSVGSNTTPRIYVYVKRHITDPVPGIVRIMERMLLGGGDIALANFVVAGTAPKQIVIELVGLGLSRFGFSDDLLLRDASLELISQVSNSVISSNSDFTYPSESPLIIDPRLVKKGDGAVIAAVLAPGCYTIVIRSLSGGGGTATLNIQDLDCDPTWGFVSASSAISYFSGVHYIYPGIPNGIGFNAHYIQGTTGASGVYRIAGPALGVDVGLGQFHFMVSSSGGTFYDTPNGWGGSLELEGMFKSLGAFPFAPSSLDAAFYLSPRGKPTQVTWIAQYTSSMPNGFLAFEYFDASNNHEAAPIVISMTRPDVPKVIGVQEGQPLTPPILANGPGSLVYEWFKNGERAPSHSNAILSLEKVSPADAGRYHCVVRNRFGIAKSQEFDVRVARRPSLSNLSVRTRLGSSSEHIILGAVVRGGQRTMLARVAGPALN